MGHGADDAVEALRAVEAGTEIYPVYRLGFARIGEGVVHIDREAVPPEPLDDVDDARVAKIGHVLLERQPQHQHARAVPGAVPGEFAGDAVGHIGAHRIVDAAAGENDFRMVTDRRCRMGQVERVHPDAVPADQPRREIQEVPLGAGGLEHVVDGQAHFLEDGRHFVDEGDVDIALGVFDHLGRLGGADVPGDEDAARGDPAIQPGQGFGDLRRLSGDHLGDAVHRVFPVAGVDAFG